MLQRFLTAGLMLAGVTAHAQTEPATMQVVGNFFANRAQVDGIECPFFAKLAQAAGIRTNITSNAMDRVGIQAAQRVRRAAQQLVLPLWRDVCLQVDQTCPATWNQTVRSVAWLTIR